MKGAGVHQCPGLSLPQSPPQSLHRKFCPSLLVMESRSVVARSSSWGGECDCKDRAQGTFSGLQVCILTLSL